MNAFLLQRVLGTAAAFSFTAMTVAACSGAGANDLLDPEGDATNLDVGASNDALLGDAPNATDGNTTQDTGPKPDVVTPDSSTPDTNVPDSSTPDAVADVAPDTNPIGVAVTGAGGNIPDGPGNCGALNTDCACQKTNNVLVSTVNVSSKFVVKRVKVVMTLVHPWAGQVEATLTHKDTGTERPIFFRPHKGFALPNDCRDQSDFNGEYVFEDAATKDMNDETNLVSENQAIPAGSYRAFGQNGQISLNANAPQGFGSEISSGNWVLHVTDYGKKDEGAVGAWTLYLDP
ncbi:MAG: hypothetical protein KBF88_12825 [Polyangiaceae bacterium]|nr:hypothetical protein [Polyangiaceae bacterium]